MVLQNKSWSNIKSECWLAPPTDDNSSDQSCTIHQTPTRPTESRREGNFTLSFKEPSVKMKMEAHEVRVTEVKRPGRINDSMQSGFKWNTTTGDWTAPRPKETVELLMDGWSQVRKRRRKECRSVILHTVALWEVEGRKGGREGVGVYKKREWGHWMS